MGAGGIWICAMVPIASQEAPKLVSDVVATCLRALNGSVGDGVGEETRPNMLDRTLAFCATTIQALVAVFVTIAMVDHRLSLWVGNHANVGAGRRPSSDTPSE
jgi:hypothetical protein